MSKQTLCNYCLFKIIRRAARAKKKKVTIIADPVWGMRGFNVYVHIPSVTIHKLKCSERVKYHRGWMAKIEDHCTCQARNNNV